MEVDARQGLFCDLDGAKAAGLVPPARDYGGVTWSDLFARANRLLRPLVSAGWILTAQYPESSFGYPESVMSLLERSGELIEVERFEDDNVVVYPDGDRPERAPDDDPTEPLFPAESDAEARAEFTARRWTATRAGRQ